MHDKYTCITIIDICLIYYQTQTTMYLKELCSLNRDNIRFSVWDAGKNLQNVKDGLLVVLLGHGWLFLGVHRVKIAALGIRFGMIFYY
jgi:hypothetical protein